MRSASMPDQSDDQRSGNISEEQIQEVSQEMIAGSKSFDISRVSVSLSDQNVTDEVIEIPTKRSSIRICGTGIIETILKLCNGCVKPIGSKLVEHKRSSI
ncbi:unnamed protein product [Onchocerca ochengi]|uniref:KIND domain-containing protein n=1 Tax=Onchocerca ochengi TaxID=42157 RepID=A0A182EMC0_ONCOC|nr:unnamed protein product [Onchocerca ochengi]